MSIFDDSRAIGLENQSFLDEGAIITCVISLVLGGEVPRLNHGPICFPIQNTQGVLQVAESQVPLFWTLS